MASARSGWVKSIPLSMTATVTPFPVTPRLGTGRAAPNPPGGAWPGGGGSFGPGFSGGSSK
ncbi:hypothetical protein D3C83_194150 [compost metagenome]